MGRLLLTALVSLALCGPGRLAAQAPADGLPCEPGYMWVAETCYREVVHKVCKLVPDTKKTTRTVYDCKVEDFCLPRCSLDCKLGCDGKKASCPECEKKVYSKKLLVKRIITEEHPTTKCQVETVVEHVPYTVYRKVPCPPVAAPCPPAAAACEGR